MSLIFLITKLPKLERNKPLLISRKLFIKQVLLCLEESELFDFNLIFQISIFQINFILVEYLWHS